MDFGIKILSDQSAGGIRFSGIPRDGIAEKIYTLMVTIPVTVKQNVTG